MTLLHCELPSPLPIQQNLLESNIIVNNSIRGFFLLPYEVYLKKKREKMFHTAVNHCQWEGSTILYYPQMDTNGYLCLLTINIFFSK